MADGTISERISRNLLNQVVGRDAELSRLVSAITGDEVLVQFVVGVSGIGKSALLHALRARLATDGLRTIHIDGDAVEPTPSSVLTALAHALGTPDADLQTVASAYDGPEDQRLLIIDSYESLGLVDTWIRQDLIPALPGHVRLVIASRLDPGPQWTQALEWRGLHRVVRLAPLSHADARALLARLDVPEARVEPIVQMSGGLPVALTLAANAARSAASPMDEASSEVTLVALARRFLDGIEDPDLREAVRAASVVRRLTRPLLKVLVPGGDAEALYARLQDLDFCTVQPDGLRLHDAVRQAVASGLNAVDPERFRGYQRASWRHLDAERRRAGRQDLWRYTADLIYLVSNPIWRNAFFPPGATTLRVEPARSEHRQGIRALAERYETDAAAELVDLWLDEAFWAFSVVVDPGGEIVGFYCLCDAADVPDRLRSGDPVAAAWLKDLAERPMAAHESALFLRRWLSQDAGEAPAPPQAASWLDIKRIYLERRPSLRRVYLALKDPAPYQSAAGTLGFKPFPGSGVPVGDAGFESALLDMGPESVDGWLSGLVAAELGLEPQGVLDRANRGLRVRGTTIPLTRREYDVMCHLEDRLDEVVGRDELLSEVWGVRYDGASNVVDTVVKALRRKLGPDAEMIETVRGHGYMLRPAPPPG